jgi:hypothetical protein
MLKKYTAGLLLCVCLTHLAGFYVYFCFRLADIRMDMREKLASLPSDQLEVVKIPKADFQAIWMEEREMKWQGQMFDIARVENRGSIVNVYCLRDHDEDGLLNMLSAIVETAQQDTANAPASVVHFFTLEYITCAVVWPAAPSTSDAQNLTAYRSTPYLVINDPLAPPPRFI